jgi:hypothetical protein
MLLMVFRDLEQLDRLVRLLITHHYIKNEIDSFKEAFLRWAAKSLLLN